MAGVEAACAVPRNPGRGEFGDLTKPNPLRHSTTSSSDRGQW
eukprot:IDg1501t1